MTTTTTTLADELRDSATRLRCDHSFPCNPPGGTLWAPGPCQHCGMPYPADDEWIPDAIREPLAALLDEYVRWAKDSITDDEEDGGPVHESDYCDGKNCRCFDRSLAVARAINGGAA